VTAIRSIQAILLLTCLLVSPLTASAVNGPVRFQHLTIDDGLPENSVRSILQDRQGFLWFGTQNGLARYDGNGMRVFLPDPEDRRSIDIRMLLTMAEDDDGGIWMGSFSKGVSRYDPVTGHFENFRCDTDSLPGPGIATITKAADGVWFTAASGGLHRWHDNRFERLLLPPLAERPRTGLTGLDVNEHDLWVGTADEGLLHWERDTDTWRQLRHDTGNPASLPSDWVTFVHRDNQGRLWVGGRAGMALHRGDGTFTVFRPRPELAANAENYLVCIAEAPDGDFWVGSAVGLYHFDPATGTFTLYAHDPDQPHSPVRGPVLSVHCDRSGIVWAGSWHTGLNKYDPGSRKFDVYLRDSDDPGSLDDDAIGAVYEDRAGTLWVGTGSRSSGGTRGGLNRRRPGSRDFEQLPFPEASGQRVFSVRDIIEDGGGRIWLATNLGVWQVDPRSDSIVRPDTVDEPPAAVHDGSVIDLAVDRADRVWVVAWSGGVHRYDPVAGAWTSYQTDPDDPRALDSNDLITVTVDDLGRVWLGADSGGLYLYQPGEDSFRRLTTLDRDLEIVFQIEPAPNGRVWVGSGSGARLCTPDSVLDAYGVRQGLPADDVSRLKLDNNGDLWVSSGLGLARIHLDDGSITVFDERDGLPRNEPHFAAYRASGGRLYFGGHHGLVSFHPDSILTNTHIPPVRLTELRIRDERVIVGDDSPLTRSLGYIDVIRLAPHQNDLSLTFASLDYSHPERNQYRFRLDPYDERWRTSTGSHSAHYTNLDPGDYVFAVVGSNGDGLAPPWWRTAWANAAYVLLVMGLAYLAYRLLINRERVHLALQIERSEARHLQDLDRLKSRFFANISHEFRTPLTLLSSPLARLQEDPASGSRDLFTTMARNARRLGRLIDQLLDLSRLEADRMPARWRHGDWLQYLKALTSPFITLAEQRQVVLDPSWPALPTEAWYDEDLLDKILVNLLSNALKFTPTGGEITLDVSVSGTPTDHHWPGQQPGPGATPTVLFLTATVRNTGSYIPPEEIEHVFDRFHQVIEDSDHADLGSGIGLALVKELTDWIGGEVEVTSSRQTGTAFRARIPMYLETPPGASAPEEEIEAALVPTAEGLLSTPTADDGADDLPPEDDTGDRPRILLAEDNADLRAYVRDELSDEFQVLVAAHGRSGLELALSEIPDLVLSDVMMPEMDGLELCRRLKSDDLTNHVPVILLTAKAEATHRREGLETGADDYVAKPFDVEELRIRIRNLIAQRRLLADRFAQLDVARPGRAANPVPSADDRFMTHIREVISANLENADFRVEGLCREVGMSRTQLHRKLTAVAGRSAGEFLRLERLNRAAEMLKENGSNVTETAYSVGYRSLSQFAKAFREQFGMAPSDYAP